MNRAVPPASAIAETVSAPRSGSRAMDEDLALLLAPVARRSHGRGRRRAGDEGGLPVESAVIAVRMLLTLNAALGGGLCAYHCSQD